MIPSLDLLVLLKHSPLKQFFMDQVAIVSTAWTDQIASASSVCPALACVQSDVFLELYTVVQPDLCLS